MKTMNFRKMVWMTIMMMRMVLVTKAKSELHYVGGGKKNWAPNVNLSEWSSHEHFYVGDWLYFGFDKNMYSVLEVNKSSYEKCIDSGFMSNITKGGRDVFQLTEAKAYYFVSGRGHCWEGLKVEIDVVNGAQQPSLPPLPHKSTASSNFCAIQMLLLSALVWSSFSY